MMTPETKARRLEDRRNEKRLNALQPIANKVTVIQDSRNHTGKISVAIGEVYVMGPVMEVNKRLEQMGFRPVRITCNMLNPNSPYFAIDINTPSYCDPGCESYHSM